MNNQQAHQLKNHPSFTPTLASRKKRKPWLNQAVLLNLLIWAVVLLSLLPILWMVLSSLRNFSEISNGEQLNFSSDLRWEIIAICGSMSIF